MEAAIMGRGTDKYGVAGDLPHPWTADVRREYQRRVNRIKQAQRPKKERVPKPRADKYGIMAKIPEKLRGTKKGKAMYLALYYKANKKKAKDYQIEYKGKHRRGPKPETTASANFICPRQKRVEVYNGRDLQEKSGTHLVRALSDILAGHRGFAGVGH